MKFHTTITLYLIFSSILLSNSSRIDPRFYYDHKKQNIDLSVTANPNYTDWPCTKGTLSAFKDVTKFSNPHAKESGPFNVAQIIANDKQYCNGDVAALQKEYQDELNALATMLNPDNPNVCWRANGTENCPEGYKECGLQCAKNDWECFKSVGIKVYKVTAFFADVAITVASFGSYSALKKGLEKGVGAGIKAGAVSVAEGMKKARKEALKGIQNLANHAGREVAKNFVKNVAKKYANSLPDDFKKSKLEQAITQEKDSDLESFLKPSWGDLSVLDPTGITDIVLAFMDSMCSNVVKANRQYIKKKDALEDRKQAKERK